MEKKDIISFDGKSMIINGKREFLYGGEFHYFRVPHELWEDRFIKMKQAGLNTVVTYIPWNFHEEKEGEFRWDGDRDLDKYIKIASKLGMYVIIKPGPYICAEWDFGGFPDWLLPKNVNLRENDPVFLKLVEGYYKNIAKVLKPHLITNGGKVVLFQIENEYDHLIAFTGIKRYRDNALEYHMKLLEMARKEGIDVPAFTVEGSFVRKTEIIEARTYYPNIPWIWLWEFNDFDRAIKASTEEQKGKPLMIMELETGWFAQFGQPRYDVPTDVTRAILRTVLAEGASVLNHFLFVGGTTFPYWNCRGDRGIGSCTTYDFGVSPVREWGDICDKFHLARNTSQFINSFKDILFDSDKKEGAAKIVKGGEGVSLVGSKSANLKPGFEGTFENVKVLQKSGQKGGFVMVRNISDSNYSMGIEYTSPLDNENRTIPAKGTLNMVSHSSYLFPVDISLADGKVIVKQSTSEVLLKKNIGGSEFIFFNSPDTLKGETILKSEKDLIPNVLEGKLQVEKTSDGFSLEYSSSGVQIIQMGNLYLVFLDDAMTKRLWDKEGNVIIADYHFIKDITITGNSIKIKADLAEGKNQKMRIFSALKLSEMKVNGEKTAVRKDEKTKSYFVNIDNEIKDNVTVRWSSDPKFMADREEIKKSFDDKNWSSISLPNSLEQAGFLKHGYTWYRQSFKIEGKPEDCSVKIETNNMDRFYVYINEKFAWRGIGNPDRNITSLVQSGDNTLAIRYENAYHTKAHPAEGPIQKLSGVMKPIEIKGKVSGKEFSIKVDHLKLRQEAGGLHKGYEKPDFNDEDWTTSKAADKYVLTEELGDFVWYRRKFKFAMKEGISYALKVRINHVTERCIMYLNGKPLGKYESVGPQNDFYVPEPFLKEENLLSIIIESPGVHPVKGSGFVPGILEDPVLDFYYTTKEVDLELI